jgi:hypothetical protein
VFRESAQEQTKRALQQSAGGRPQLIKGSLPSDSNAAGILHQPFVEPAQHFIPVALPLGQVLAESAAPLGDVSAGLFKTGEAAQLLGESSCLRGSSAC